MLCNFGLKSYLWFQIELALRARSILKSRVWFQPKLHSTQFNYHYVQLLLIVWQIFGNSPSGGAVLHYLLEWVQNGHAERYIKEVLQHLQPYNSPSYWPAVSNVFSLLTRVMLIHLNSICCWDFTNKAFCFPLRSTVWFSKVVLMMCVNCLLSILTDKQENMMLVYLSIHWRNLTSLVSKDIESEKEI